MNKYLFAVALSVALSACSTYDGQSVSNTTGYSAHFMCKTSLRNTPVYVRYHLRNNQVVSARVTGREGDTGILNYNPQQSDEQHNVYTGKRLSALIIPKNFDVKRDTPTIILAGGFTLARNDICKRY